MKLFSERYGHVRTRNGIQLDSMDDALRTRLWNACDAELWEAARSVSPFKGPGYRPLDAKWARFVGLAWDRVAKKPRDELSARIPGVFNQVKQWYFRAQWNDVYDFLEVLAQNLPIDAGPFLNACNVVFTEEQAGWRFDGDTLVPITDEVELQAVDEAAWEGNPSQEARAHIKEALRSFPPGPRPISVAQSTSP